ncbi:hypothetical protein A4G20_10970 [Pasteurellaceae bacterium RH1A]|nr:hypothetical protein A4G20_10970 [Pasteurellaceae bacterium RH1A]
MKKLLLPALLVLISACSTSSKQTAFPGEFANADYVLSDKDAQRWVALSRQAEACIYPNLTRIQQQHFSKEDAYIHSQYVFFYPLEEVIGADYVKILQEDEKSMGYATLLFKQYKQSDYKPLKAQQCEVLRKQARDDLAVVKGQYMSGMAEQAATEPNNPDGVATGQNKFFFDIIKWGAALLL